MFVLIVSSLAIATKDQQHKVEMASDTADGGSMQWMTMTLCVPHHACSPVEPAMASAAKLTEDR